MCPLLYHQRAVWHSHRFGIHQLTEFAFVDFMIADIGVESNAVILLIRHDRAACYDTSYVGSVSAKAKVINRQLCRTCAN
jgi:hypothetical protein